MKNSVSIQDRVLDISVNLTRIGNWASDSNLEKKDLIKFFLDQTENYLSEIKKQRVSKEFRSVLEMFSQEFKKLKKQEISKDKDRWAEHALTWANILSHRAKFA